jgi:hypothetical protein
MGRYKTAELRRFQEISHCTACVHYTGCSLWMSLLLLNEEPVVPGLDFIITDITKPCPMFFAWTKESARKHSSETRGSDV